MSVEYADSLIVKGHELWNKGDITGAFALQNIALSIKRRIERESDYRVILTSKGLEVQQARDKAEADQLYQEAYNRFLSAPQANADKGEG